MALFEDAIPTVLENEGGYVNNPKDPGGETNFGISKRAYPDLDIKNLTVEGATAIYLRDFWKFGGIQSQSVATKVFDMCVLAKHNAIKVLQELVNATVDGAYGSETERLVNAELDAARLLANYRIAMIDYFIEVARKNPDEANFLKGWLKRARQ